MKLKTCETVSTKMSDAESIFERVMAEIFPNLKEK